MFLDLAWSYRFVTIYLRVFGLSVASLTERGRHEIYARYSRFVLCVIVLSSAGLTYGEISGRVASTKAWIMVGMYLSARFSVMYSLWTTLREFRTLIEIFEVIKIVDRNLERLGHSIDHYKNRKIICTHLAFAVVSTIAYWKLIPLRVYFNPVVSYTLYFASLHLLGQLWAVIVEFYTLVLMLRQRLSVLRKCLKNFPSRTAPDITIVRLVGSAPRLKQEVKTINLIIRDLFGVQRSIAGYYSTRVGWFVINTVLSFGYATYRYQMLKSMDKFKAVIFYLVVCSVYVVCALLSCALLKTEIQKVKNNIIELSVSRTDTTSKQIEKWTLKLIHENTEISCSLFDFNLDVIPAMIDVICVLVFGIIQE